MSESTNMFGSPTGLSSNQVAAIGEALVAVELIKCSKGELSPSKPITDDYGIDLDVQDEVQGRGARLQIKTRASEQVEPKGLYGFGLISQRTEVKSHHFVLGILLHMETNAIVAAWLIPTVELPKVAARKKDNGWKVTPNASPSSRDRFAPFRCDSMSAVVVALREALKGQVPGGGVQPD